MLEEKEREGGEKKGYEDRTKAGKSECEYHDREIVDLMERRNVDVLCVQET